MDTENKNTTEMENTAPRFDFHDFMDAVDEVTRAYDQAKDIPYEKRTELMDAALFDVLAWLDCWGVPMSKAVKAVGVATGLFTEDAKND